MMNDKINLTLDKEFYIKLQKYAKKNKRTIKATLEIIIDRVCL